MQTLDETSTLPDEKLLAAIEHATSRRISPEQIEDEVGQRAWINTIRSAERVALNTANIGPDETMSKILPSLRGARNVVYWGRPTASHNPQIVGVVWHKDGLAEMFFGTLYPP